MKEPIQLEVEQLEERIAPSQPPGCSATKASLATRAVMAGSLLGYSATKASLVIRAASP